MTKDWGRLELFSFSFGFIKQFMWYIQIYKQGGQRLKPGMNLTLNMFGYWGLVYLFTKRSSSSFRISLILSVCLRCLSGSVESEQKPFWKEQVVSNTHNRQNLEMFYSTSHSIAWLQVESKYWLKSTFPILKCLRSKSITLMWEWLGKAFHPTGEQMWWLQPLACLSGPLSLVPVDWGFFQDSL